MACITADMVRGPTRQAERKHQSLSITVHVKGQISAYDWNNDPIGGVGLRADEDARMGRRVPRQTLAPDFEIPVGALEAAIQTESSGLRSTARSEPESYQLGTTGMSRSMPSAMSETALAGVDRRHACSVGQFRSD